ncbi:hypothetical protein AAHE18_01G166700 [Arachis hypogaea]
MQPRMQTTPGHVMLPINFTTPSLRPIERNWATETTSSSDAAAPSKPQTQWLIPRRSRSIFREGVSVMLVTAIKRCRPQDMEPALLTWMDMTCTPNLKADRSYVMTST